MTASEQPENWGELGPAMRVLNERQRLFVRALLLEKPGYGAATNALTARPDTARPAKPRRNPKKPTRCCGTTASSLLIAEEAKKVIRGIGHAEAVSALLNMVRDPEHRDHARAVDMIMRRVDPEVNKYSVDVTHRVDDPDREALEEIRALRKLGTARDKLLELYGPNGLDRLESLGSRRHSPPCCAGQDSRGQGDRTRGDRWLTTTHPIPRDC